MEVKGDLIIHGSFIDIHDNDRVDLRVDRAEVHINGKGIREIRTKVMQVVDTETPMSNDGKKSKLIACIEALMEEKDEKGKYLVNHASQWIAIFRVIVDKGLGTTNTDYQGFCCMIDGVKTKEFRIPLRYESLKAITKTNYTNPLDKWEYDSLYNPTRKPYDGMVRVATRFKEILEANGL